MEAICQPRPLALRLLGLPALAVLAALILLWRTWAISQSGATLYVDEAQYWVWAQSLSWGYFSKPPGIAALIWLSTALFGDGLLGVKMLAMLCYPAAALFAWLIARRLYDAVVAGWAALIVMTLPIYAWLGLFVTTDALLSLFWLVALWCYLRVLDTDRWQDWLMLGAACGLGVLAKYTMLVFVAVAGVHLLAFHRSRLASFRPWSACLILLLLLAPNLAWNVAHDFPTLKHTADITLNRQAGDRWLAILGFVASQCLLFGPLLGGVAVWGMIRRRAEAPAALLLWFSLPLWCVVALQAFNGGANTNWAAPAFAPLAIAIAGWLVAGRREGLLKAGIGFNIALAALAYHAPVSLAALEVVDSARLNPYLRATGWHELAEQLRPATEAHRDAVLLADNRTLLAHLRYELRDLDPTVVSWNPRREASDHFRLTTDLNHHLGGDALYVAEQAPDAAMLARFSASQRMPALHVSLDAKTSRHYEVYLLHGFQGY